MEKTEKAQSYGPSYGPSVMLVDEISENFQLLTKFVAEKICNKFFKVP